jgi:prevent-host-death family protein
MMVSYRRDEIVSVTELARNLSVTLGGLLKKTKEKIAIAKNNKLQAVIIDIDEYERLKEAEETLEHLQIARELEGRTETKKEEYLSLEDAASAVGLDLKDV